MQVVFDTGSPDTWVYSPECCYAQDHSFFQPSDSNTYRNRTVSSSGTARIAAKGTPGADWQIAYGGGSATEGYIGYDTMSLANQGLRLDQQSVALATAITGASRRTRAMEGLVGLSNGASSQAPGGWTTPLESLAKDGRLSKPYLTAALVKANRRTGAGGGGNYILGGTDLSLQAGPVVWTPVTSTIYWGITYDDMQFADAGSIIPDQTTRSLIVDTGSALINLPKAAAKQANEQLYGSQYSSALRYWLVPCDTGLPEYEAGLEASAKNQPFVVVIEGQSFAVPPEDFVFYPNSPVPASNADGQSRMCISAFQAGPDQFAILGATFIKNHLVSLVSDAVGHV